MKTSIAWIDSHPDAYILSDAYVSFVNEYSTYRATVAEAATSMALILAEAQDTLSKPELDRLRGELRLEDHGSGEFSVSYSVEV
jgi:hypothetical protein